MAGSESQLRIFGAGSVLEQPNRVKRVHAAMFAAGSGCAACRLVATMPCGNFLNAGKIRASSRSTRTWSLEFFFIRSRIGVFVTRWARRSGSRIAVLVVGGRVEVGGPWPHSPLADERLPLGSQSLSVVAALRLAGGLLRRGSGQLKVGLLVLGLVREQQCNAPVRTG